MALANRVVGIIMALFVMGAVGATAVVMASNATVYNNTGVSAPVIAMFTIGVPIMAAVAIMMYFLPNRAMSLSPILVVLRWLNRFRRDKRAALANRVVGIIMALFIMGAVGATAVIMASNATAYAGAPAPVIAMFTIGVPIMAAVAIMMYFLPNRAVSLSPLLFVVGFVDKAHGWLRKLLCKLGRC